MTLWVVTQLATDSDQPTTQITAETDSPVHLQLSLSPTSPTQLPRYQTRRGTRRLCGFYLHWHGVTCYDQDEPGPTLTHTFTVASPPIGATWYYALTEACPPAHGSPSTVPIPLLGVPEVTGTWIFLRQTTTQTIPSGVNTQIQWDTIVASSNWPNPTLPFFNLTPPVNGTYRLVGSLGIASTGITRLMATLSRIGQTNALTPRHNHVTDPLANQAQLTVDGTLQLTTSNAIFMSSYHEGPNQGTTNAPTRPALLIELLK